MVGCCLGVLDAQQVAQGSPQGGGELGDAGRCDDPRDTESSYPPLKHSICAVYCCGGSDGDRFRPDGDSVHDREQIGETPGHGGGGGGLLIPHGCG
jgi:hypothetical protein